MDKQLLSLGAAVVAGVLFGVVMFRQSRERVSGARRGVRIIFGAVGAGGAVYYILWVALGPGRTGWP